MLKLRVALVVGAFVLAACGTAARQSPQSEAESAGYGPRDPSYTHMPGDPGYPWPRGQALMESEGP